MNAYLLNVAKLQRSLLWLIFILLIGSVGLVWLAVIGAAGLPNFVFPVL